MLARIVSGVAAWFVLAASALCAASTPLPGTVIEFGAGYSPSNYGIDRSGAPSASAFVVFPVQGRMALQAGLVSLHHKSNGETTFLGATLGARYYISKGTKGGIFLQASPSIYAGIWGKTHLLPGFQEGGGATLQVAGNLLLELEAVYILTADHTERFSDGSRVLEGLNHGMVSVRLGLLL